MNNNNPKYIPIPSFAGTQNAMTRASNLIVSGFQPLQNSLKEMDQVRDTNTTNLINTRTGNVINDIYHATSLDELAEMQTRADSVLGTDSKATSEAYLTMRKLLTDQGNIAESNKLAAFTADTNRRKVGQGNTKLAQDQVNAEYRTRFLNEYFKGAITNEDDLAMTSLAILNSYKGGIMPTDAAKTDAEIRGLLQGSREELPTGDEATNAGLVKDSLASIKKETSERKDLISSSMKEALGYDKSVEPTGEELSNEQALKSANGVIKDLGLDVDEDFNTNFLLAWDAYHKESGKRLTGDQVYTLINDPLVGVTSGGDGSGLVGKATALGKRVKTNDKATEQFNLVDSENIDNKYKPLFTAIEKREKDIDEGLFSHKIAQRSGNPDKIAEAEANLGNLYDMTGIKELQKEANRSYQSDITAPIYKEGGETVFSQSQYVDTLGDGAKARRESSDRGYRELLDKADNTNSQEKIKGIQNLVKNLEDNTADLNEYSLRDRTTVQPEEVRNLLAERDKTQEKLGNQLSKLSINKTDGRVIPYSMRY